MRQNLDKEKNPNIKSNEADYKFQFFITYNKK